VSTSAGPNKEAARVLALGWLISASTALILGDSPAGAAGRSSLAAVVGLMVGAFIYAIFGRRDLVLIFLWVTCMTTPMYIRFPPRPVGSGYCLQWTACTVSMVCAAALLRRLIWGPNT
jgi:hypothetical protein